MPKKIEDILDQLTAEIGKGRSIEECLREYGEYADELRPLLELCQDINGLPKPEPDARRVAAVVREARSTHEQKKKQWFSIRNILVLRPVAVRVAVAVVAVLLVATTTVMLSANSLPGDTLYSVKLFTERIQYFLTLDTEGKARLHLMFADRRTNEFACLVQPGLPVDKRLLTNMLKETRLAIDHIALLSRDEAARLIEHADECNHVQLSLLEKARAHACEHDKAAVEEAIRTCREQKNCIDCIQNPDAKDRTHCPCDVSEALAN